MNDDGDLPIGADVRLMPEGPIVAEQYARVCAAEHGEDMRFVPAFGEWLVWDEPDGIWRPDSAAAMLNIGDFCLRAVESRKKSKDKEKLGSFTFVSQLERRMRPLLASEPHEWDADPMLLNTPGPWTINLETGEKRESRREDRLTKSTAVGPMGKCPLWMSFLERIFEGDQDRIRFIQRMAGYCATGSTQEQCLFFLYGTGQNGKGTLVHTLNYVLKDYVANTAIETFAGGKFERHPEELAVLRGARMVLGSETTEGAGWNEGRLKQVTGGDLVRARFMRTNSFEYVPHFKLVISGNHLPTLSSIDPAIERRFHIVPFNYRVPDHEKDQGLEEALRHEASGILQWVIDGCQEWQLLGLNPPDHVRGATRDYLKSEDAFKAWLEEACDQGGTEFTPVKTLYGADAPHGFHANANPNAWRHWAEARNFDPKTIRVFGRWLTKELGPSERRYDGTVRGYKGIALKAATAP